MTKEDLSEHGFSIILPDDPSYGAELEKLGPSANFRAERLGPSSVVVKNTSRRAIVAFGVRFTERSADGHIGTSDVVSSQPSALVDLGQPSRYDKPMQGLIMPGVARLVTTDGLVDPAIKGGTSYRVATPGKIIKVQLDSAVFDDGEVIGPDQLDLGKALRAHIDAQQDLMEEISDRLSRGELLHNVLVELQRTTWPKTGPIISPQLDTSDAYSLARRQYLDELTTTEANAGDEVAIRRLRQLKYATRPSIHRLTGEN
jgi:hypothetical protein